MQLSTWQSLNINPGLSSLKAQGPFIILFSLPVCKDLIRIQLEPFIHLFVFSETEVTNWSPNTKSHSPVSYILPYFSIYKQSTIAIEHAWGIVLCSLVIGKVSYTWVLPSRNLQSEKNRFCCNNIPLFSIYLCLLLIIQKAKIYFFFITYTYCDLAGS